MKLRLLFTVFLFTCIAGGISMAHAQTLADNISIADLTPAPTSTPTDTPTETPSPTATPGTLPNTGDNGTTITITASAILISLAAFKLYSSRPNH